SSCTSRPGDVDARLRGRILEFPASRRISGGSLWRGRAPGVTRVWSTWSRWWPRGHDRRHRNRYRGSGTGPMTEPVGFHDVVARHPDRVAVIDPDGTTQTFAEFAAAVNRLSHALRAEGLTTGDRVVTMAPN